jgi:hypothetical protein
MFLDHVAPRNISELTFLGPKSRNICKLMFLDRNRGTYLTLCATTGRGTVRAGRGGAGRPASAAGRGRADGQRPGGARLGRSGAGPGRVVGTCYEAGPGRGRHEAVEGSDGRASVKGGGVRRGRRPRTGGARLRQVGPAVDTHCGAGSGGQRAVEARRGPPGHGRSRAGVADAWGAGSQGGRCMGCRQRGAEERGRTKKWVGFTNCALMFLNRAEEHKDPHYVPHLPDMAEEHKSLCSSEI